MRGRGAVKERMSRGSTLPWPEARPLWARGDVRPLLAGLAGERAARAVTLLAMALFAGGVGGLAVFRHARFASYSFDLGIYEQALWLISRGEVPFVTVRGVHVLGDHFTPILYPLALLYRLGVGIEGLVLFQAAALALGAWPLYRMGTRVTGSPWMGTAAAVAYLLYPPLRAIACFDFHPIALAIPGLLFALDFAFEQRAAPMLLACLWSVLCKQEVAVVVACLGIWYAVRWRQPRALGLTAAGVAWFALALRLTAHFAGVSESGYLDLYSRYGHSTAEVLRTFLLTPCVPLGHLAGHETGRYLLLLLVPLALLPLRSPGILWLLAFPLALNLFSNRDFMRGLEHHYTALLIPVLFAAAVATVARARAGWPRRTLVSAWLFCAAAAAWAVVPREQQRAWKPVLSAGGATEVRAALAAIPAGASVSASHSLVAHVSARRQAYLFPNPFLPAVYGPGSLPIRQLVSRTPLPVDPVPFRSSLLRGEVEYLALDYRLMRHYTSFPLAWDGVVSTYTEALRSPTYGLVADQGGVWVLRRGADQGAGLKRLGLSPSDPVERFHQRLWDRMTTQWKLDGVVE